MYLGNEKGKFLFKIPVEWTMYEVIKVQADSLEEAVQWFVENLDEIPLDETGKSEYIDGSYKASNGVNDTYDEDEIKEMLTSFGYNEGEKVDD